MARENSGELVKKLIRGATAVVVVFGTLSIGYLGVRGNVAGRKVTELFNEKANIYGPEGRIPDSREISLACKSAGIPYDCTNPRGLTIDEKRQYLYGVHGIILDKWGRRINP